MFRFNPLLLFSLVLCLQATAIAQDRPSFLHDDVNYLWPTNASYYMSSSFAETRSAHFHAALDIGTWGRTGYRIFATRDGVLHRVGVSPTGYGNVIYLKHNDGSYSLYAHLKDFVPEIRSIVDSIRFERDYSFEFDEVLEHHQIHFKQGDLIGLSGATGIGPPHLHFELRTPQGLPFNPLLTNISVPDRIPPRFVSLSVEPLSQDAVVNGNKDILQRRVSRSGSNNHFGTIPVSGTVGLGVQVYDQADGVNNVYAVYDLKLKVNDELYFHSRVDSFSYQDTHQMFLDRVYPILRDSRRGFQRLYVKNANRLPFYKDTGKTGTLNLPAGLHHFEIIASDYFGNTSTADGYLDFRDEESIPYIRSQINNTPPTRHSNFLPSSPLQNWHWHNNWLAPPQTSQALIASVSTPGSFKNNKKTIHLTRPNQAIDLGRPSSKIIALEHNTPVMLHRINPDESNVFYSQDQRMSVKFRPGSVYDVMSVGFNHHVGENNLPYIRLYPEHQPIHKKARISYVLDSQQALKNTLAFYYKNSRRNTYEYVTTKRYGSVITGDIRHFDTFYILEDSLGPEISQPKIYQRNDGKWGISVKVTDDLSGIDHQASEFYWNDIRGIAEYDPEEDLLHYHLPGFKPKNLNRIKVVVSDRVGNVTEKTFQMRY